MKDTYFKTRRPLWVREHPFDIGSPIGFWNYYDDNHFLKRYYLAGYQTPEEFYNYHMEHAVNTGKCTEAEFYEHIREIVADHIEFIRKQSPFSPKHKRYRIELKHLRAFRDYLITINTFGYRDPVDITITRYDTEIAALKAKIAEKDKLIEVYKKFETKHKVRITKGYLDTLIDLIQQLPKINLPGKDTRLLRSSTEIVWVKIICKYFQHGDEAISYETTRAHFTPENKKPGTKYDPIEEKHKLFRIVEKDGKNRR